MLDETGLGITTLTIKATDFDPDEEELTGVYQKRADEVSKDMQKSLKSDLDGVSKTKASIILGLGYVASKARNMHNRDIDEAVKSIVDNTIQVGSKRINSVGTSGYNFYVDAVSKGMTKISKFYSNKFFDDVIMPKIRKNVEKSFQDGASGSQLLNEVLNDIDNYYGGVPSWKVAANATASRAYHYGLTKTAYMQGYTTVRFSAVLDNRTSDICLALDGTTWEIARIVETLEDIALVDDPSYLKDASPWIRSSDYDGLTDSQMEAAGVQIPPRHGNCRSVLVID